MNIVRSLVGPAPSAGAAGGEQPPAAAAAAAQGLPAQEPAQLATGDAGGDSPAPFTPDGKAGAAKGGVLPSPPPGSGSSAAPHGEGVTPPTPGPGPDRRLDMPTPPPDDEWREGHEAEAEAEAGEGDEAWYYGADTVRRGWRHTENQLAVWVTALLVLALGINIGVGGERGVGRREERCGRQARALSRGDAAALKAGRLCCRAVELKLCGSSAAPVSTHAARAHGLVLCAPAPALTRSDQLQPQQPHQEHCRATGRAGCGSVCATTAAVLAAALPVATAVLAAALPVATAASAAAALVTTAGLVTTTASCATSGSAARRRPRRARRLERVVRPVEGPLVLWRRLCLRHRAAGALGGRLGLGRRCGAGAAHHLFSSQQQWVGWARENAAPLGPTSPPRSNGWSGKARMRLLAGRHWAPTRAAPWPAWPACVWAPTAWGSR